MRSVSFDRSLLRRAAGIAAAVLTASLAIGILPLSAQSENPVERLSALNDSLLQAHARTRGANPATTVELRRDAARVIRRRAAALRELAEQNPAEALRRSLSPEALQELAGAFPEEAAMLELRGSWRGPVETVVFDSDDMKTHRTVHYLRRGGETIDVHVGGSEPDTKCGDIVEFSGVRVGNTVAALSAKVVASAGASACVPTGQQKIAVLMVNFPGYTVPSNVTAQGVRDVMTSTAGPSLDGFWREASYNKAWATADVFGWYTLNATYTCDQIGLIQAAAIQAADADVYFPNYNRIVILFPTPSSGCSYSGTATVGCTTMSSPGDGTFNASAAFLLSAYFGTRDLGVKLAAHEAGHNLGLMHSRSRAFAGEPLGAPGATGTLNEYGDINSTMGSWNFGHYTGSQKRSLGWQADVSNVVTVQGSGTFVIAPTETPSAGPQTLKIQRGTGSNAWLWVEYRQPVGIYDSTLNPQVFTGALVHYQDSITGENTDLLDYTTGTTVFNDASLAVGQTWKDPYSNLTLQIQAASPSGLTVSVSYGAVPCAPANPSITLSPLNPSVYSGGSVAYSASVTNNDSSACATGTFNFSSVQPSGWSAALSTTSLLLNPGQSASFTLTVTVPVGAAPATYPVSASVSRAGAAVTANANCTVIAPPLPLTATIATSATSYATRSTVTMTAQVRSGTLPASGASVTFRMVGPDGSLTVKTVATGSNGVATWAYKLSPKDVAGMYSVTVTATSGSMTAAANPVTFTVK
jgi:M6 family metalloprotease-like protein